MTQRGNRRERVFFSPGDHGLISSAARISSNRPSKSSRIASCRTTYISSWFHQENGLQCALRAVHGQYAQRINRMRGQKGHLWQGRYFSSPLDSNYFLNAVRYVELNPGKSRHRCQAEESHGQAQRHIAACETIHCNRVRRSTHVLAGIANWSRWLAEVSPTNRSKRCASTRARTCRVDLWSSWSNWNKWLVGELRCRPARTRSGTHPKRGVPFRRERPLKGDAPFRDYIVTFTGESSVKPSTVPAGRTTSLPVFFAAAVPAAAPRIAPMTLPWSLSNW